MAKLTLIIVLTLLAAAVVSTAQELRLLSWNVRYDSKPDNISLSETISSLPVSVPTDEEVTFYATPAEAPWSTRRIAIAREVSFSQPAVIGVQEALVRQVRDLASLFGSCYSWVGVGRDDGKETGEFEAVFFRTDLVELLKWDTFWLSPTPFTPSKFPGAGSTRSATRALFRTIGTRTNFTAIVTHWDDQSDPQRQLAASLVRQRSAYEAAQDNGPVIVLGDFNSPSSGEGSAGYEIMTGGREPVAIPKDFAERYHAKSDDWVFTDLAVATDPLERSGHHATFTGFQRHPEMDLKRIDFVMAGGEGWKARRYRVGESWWDQESMASDHRPVWVDIALG